MEVEYRDIPGFPGYRVGSDGSIWSKKIGKSKRLLENWRRLKPATRISGHQFLYLYRDEKPRHCYVHKLVLISFVGYRPQGMECCHKDGDPKNNHVTNLRWGTRSDNMRDAIGHGTHYTPFRDHNITDKRRKFSDQQIAEMFRLRSEGDTCSSIAKRFGANKNYVSQILQKKVRNK